MNSTSQRDITQSAAKRRGAFTLVELLVVIAIIGVLIALLLPAVQAAREAARRAQCTNNLKQLALGMHNHHDVNRHFPQNRIGGSDYGWTAYQAWSATYRILPYIEQENLYNQFDRNAGWSANRNGPMETRVDAFICPSAIPAPSSSQISWGGPGSNYGWCTGSSVKTVWGSASEHTGMIIHAEELKMADTTDGLSNTILASELLSGTGVNSGTATYPFDIFYTNDSHFNSVANKSFPTASELDSIGAAAASPTGFRGNNGSLWAWYAQGHSAFNGAATPNWKHPNVGGNCCPGGGHDWGVGIVAPRSMHPTGVNAAMGDGSVHFITDTVDLVTFQRLCHRSDGVSVELP